MTVSKNVSFKSIISTGASSYEIDFPWFDEDDLRIYVDGELQTKTTDYSISGTGKDNSITTITFVSPPTTGLEIAILRVVEVKQPIDYVINDGFSAESHERALDRITFILQQLDEELGRIMKLPEAEDSYTFPTKDGRINKVFGFDENGDIKLYDLDEASDGTLTPIWP